MYSWGGFIGGEWRFNFRRDLNDREVDEIGSTSTFFGTSDP